MIINRNDYDVQKCAKRGETYFCIWDITTLVVQSKKYGKNLFTCMK